MPEATELMLARPADAEAIAVMSRDLIESGLKWSWTPARVAKQIHCRATVVLVAQAREGLVGFAIMHFRDEDAHLNLLAVSSSHRRSGIGRHLVEWLERSADVAGISTIHLELRANNPVAHSFYRSLGYHEVEFRPGYYCGRETALRMARDLRATRWPGLDQNDPIDIVSSLKTNQRN